MSRTAVDIVSIVRDAGIVGAGGAGFPTHVKLGNAVETVIANGAECEPILEADKHLMEKEPGSFIRGMEAAMEQVGARKGIIGIKDSVKIIIVCRFVYIFWTINITQRFELFTSFCIKVNF